MVYFALWCASGLAGGWIGSGRGQSASGLILGLLLGPLGWLLTAASEDLRPKCPDCRGTVVPGATRCRNCGEPLPHPARAAGRASTGASRRLAWASVGVFAALAVGVAVLRFR